MQRNNLEIYEEHADAWWDPKRPWFRSLQKITVFRLALLKAWVPELNVKNLSDSEFTVVDLGCGGGLLSAPLSNDGARVYGFDLSEASLREAAAHSSPTAVYTQGDIRQVAFPSESADLVILADVLDHLEDYEKVLHEAYRILRPGGKVFVNTINRNLLSVLLAVHIGENIGLVPKGTHDPKLFIRPKELEKKAARAGFHVASWQGERPALLKTIRDWAIHFTGTKSLLVAYSALLIKMESRHGLH